MSELRVNMMMSLDGYTAGPEQSAENPFGLGGMQLNEWLFPLRAFRELQGEEGGEDNASGPIVEGWFENIGATVMGRNMFGGGPGPWDPDPWNGFWGANPPYHHPVFVLTHLSPTVTRTLVELVAGDADADRRHEEARERVATLSEREREVALAVGRGLANALEIASELFMSVATVKAYVSRLFTKLGVENRVQIALLVQEAQR
jgi:DNA-binding CsgD family transcriptional regulator